mmetsp:Transcript_28552/g.71506  ORF Transcript_28552/g.71506 Transcript_28552/m.71506 type:complete len:224 (+) Transcript_28552:584-1255(+)
MKRRERQQGPEGSRIGRGGVAACLRSLWSRRAPHACAAALLGTAATSSLPGGSGRRTSARQPRRETPWRQGWCGRLAKGTSCPPRRLSWASALCFSWQRRPARTRTSATGLPGGWPVPSQVTRVTMRVAGAGKLRTMMQPPRLWKRSRRGRRRTVTDSFSTQRVSVRRVAGVGTVHTPQRASRRGRMRLHSASLVLLTHFWTAGWISAVTWIAKTQSRRRGRK